MKKLIFIFFGIVLWSCDSEDANDCFQKAGAITSEEIVLESFDEILVYDKIKLFIEQGEQQKVVVETGENLRNEVSAEVIDGQLVLRNENDCNFVRDFNITKVYVTVPDLTYLRHAGNLMIESVGTLRLDELWLVSENQDKDIEVGGLTLSEEDALKAQIFGCWSIPLGLPYSENLLVRIRLKLKPDGTVIKSEILDHARMNKPGQGFYKVLAESALRAIRLCQPLRVPTTGYERWKEMQLNFDAKEMLEG